MSDASALFSSFMELLGKNGSQEKDKDKKKSKSSRKRKRHSSSEDREVEDFWEKARREAAQKSKRGGSRSHRSHEDSDDDEIKIVADARASRFDRAAPLGAAPPPKKSPPAVSIPPASAAAAPPSGVTSSAAADPASMMFQQMFQAQALMLQQQQAAVFAAQQAAMHAALTQPPTATTEAPASFLSQPQAVDKLMKAGIAPAAAVMLDDFRRYMEDSVYRTNMYIGPGTIEEFQRVQAGRSLEVETKQSDDSTFETTVSLAGYRVSGKGITKQSSIINAFLSTLPDQLRDDAGHRANWQAPPLECATGITSTRLIYRDTYDQQHAFVGFGNKGSGQQGSSDQERRRGLLQKENRAALLQEGRGGGLQDARGAALHENRPVVQQESRSMREKRFAPERPAPTPLFDVKPFSTPPAPEAATGLGEGAEDSSDVHERRRHSRFGGPPRPPFRPETGPPFRPESGPPFRPGTGPAPPPMTGGPFPHLPGAPRPPQGGHAPPRASGPGGSRMDFTVPPPGGAVRPRSMRPMGAPWGDPFLLTGIMVEEKKESPPPPVPVARPQKEPLLTEEEKESTPPPDSPPPQVLSEAQKEKKEELCKPIRNPPSMSSCRLLKEMAIFLVDEYINKEKGIAHEEALSNFRKHFAVFNYHIDNYPELDLVVVTVDFNGFVVKGAGRKAAAAIFDALSVVLTPALRSRALEQQEKLIGKYVDPTEPNLPRLQWDKRCTPAELRTEPSMYRSIMGKYKERSGPSKDGWVPSHQEAPPPPTPLAVALSKPEPDPAEPPTYKPLLGGPMPPHLAEFIAERAHAAAAPAHEYSAPDVEKVVKRKALKSLYDLMANFRVFVTESLGEVTTANAFALDGAFASFKEEHAATFRPLLPFDKPHEDAISRRLYFYDLLLRGVGETQEEADLNAWWAFEEFADEFFPRAILKLKPETKVKGSTTESAPKGGGAAGLIAEFRKATRPRPGLLDENEDLIGIEMTGGIPPPTSGRGRRHLLPSDPPSRGPLPPLTSLAEVDEMEGVTSDFVLFSNTKPEADGKFHPFSNAYPRKCAFDGRLFETAEHVYLYIIAMEHGDPELAEQILATPFIPVAHGLIEAKVEEGFDIKIWNEAGGRKAMASVLTAKFSQHPDLLERLMATGNSHLVECSDGETTWGCGLDHNAPGAKILIEAQADRWPGANWFGRELMKVRKREQMRREALLV